MQDSGRVMNCWRSVNKPERQYFDISRYQRLFRSSTATPL